MEIARLRNFCKRLLLWFVWLLNTYILVQVNWSITFYSINIWIKVTDDLPLFCIQILFANVMCSNHELVALVTWKVIWTSWSMYLVNLCNYLHHVQQSSKPLKIIKRRTPIIITQQQYQVCVNKSTHGYCWRFYPAFYSLLYNFIKLLLP